MLRHSSSIPARFFRAWACVTAAPMLQVTRPSILPTSSDEMQFTPQSVCTVPQQPDTLAVFFRVWACVAAAAAGASSRPTHSSSSPWCSCNVPSPICWAQKSAPTGPATGVPVLPMPRSVGYVCWLPSGLFWFSGCGYNQCSSERSEWLRMLCSAEESSLHAFHLHDKCFPLLFIAIFLLLLFFFFMRYKEWSKLSVWLEIFQNPTSRIMWMW